jgi:shikimate kinase
VRAIFGTDGEQVFRALESAAIAAALREFGGVLALGGGALTSPATRAALAGAGVPVVRLQAPLATLAVRIGDGRTRPLLAGDPLARLAELATEREPLYCAAATLTIRTENRTPGQVAAQIAARLHERAAQ